MITRRSVSPSYNKDSVVNGTDYNMYVLKGEIVDADRLQAQIYGNGEVSRNEDDNMVIA